MARWRERAGGLCVGVASVGGCGCVALRNAPRQATVADGPDEPRIAFSLEVAVPIGGEWQPNLERNVGVTRRRGETGDAAEWRDTFCPGGVPYLPGKLGTSKSGGGSMDLANVNVVSGILRDARLSHDCWADAGVGASAKPAEQN